MELELIENKQDLLKNIETIDEYLKKDNDTEGYKFAVKSIKSGTCFIAISTESGFKFYPAKFLGYKNNDMDACVKYRSVRHGGVARHQISKIINNKPNHNSNLEEKYIKYCASLNFDANKTGSHGHERKYWTLT